MEAENARRKAFQELMRRLQESEESSMEASRRVNFTELHACKLLFTVIFILLALEYSLDLFEIEISIEPSWLI